MDEHSISVLLLLDSSGSMYGEKIYALNTAVSSLIEGFQKLCTDKDPQLAIITYGSKLLLHTPFTPVGNIAFKSIEAEGKSLLTEALVLAKSIIKKETALILISDGLPNDGGFERALSTIPFLSSIYAIPIGFDADDTMLEIFTGSSNRVIAAADAYNMAEYILIKDREAL